MFLAIICVIISVLGPPAAFCAGVFHERHGRVLIGRKGYFSVVAAVHFGVLILMFAFAKVGMIALRAVDFDLQQSDGTTLIIVVSGLVMVIIYPMAFGLGQCTRQRLRSAKMSEELAYPLVLLLICSPLYVLLCIPGGGSYQPAKQLTEKLSLDHYNQRRKNDYQA